MTKYEELKKKCGFVNGLVGTNEKGENIIVTVDPISATIRTSQKNGWMRTNIYWADGTEEETYAK